MDRAEALADVQHAELVEQASQRFTSDLDEEINRLKALRQVNPLVRDSEIDTLEKHKAEGKVSLQHAKVRLDALRILVAG